MVCHFHARRVCTWAHNDARWKVGDGKFSVQQHWIAAISFKIFPSWKHLECFSWGEMLHSWKHLECFQGEMLHFTRYQYQTSPQISNSYWNHHYNSWKSWIIVIFFCIPFCFPILTEVDCQWALRLYDSAKDFIVDHLLSIIERVTILKKDPHVVPVAVSDI